MFFLLRLTFWLGLTFSAMNAPTGATHLPAVSGLTQAVVQQAARNCLDKAAVCASAASAIAELAPPNVAAKAAKTAADLAPGADKAPSGRDRRQVGP